jgi:REase_MTES_1575
MDDLHPAVARSVRRALGQDGAILRRQVFAAGVTPGQLRHLVRSGAWRSPCRGAFVVSAAHPLRGPVRAAMLVCPGAIACDVTAARLAGLLGTAPPHEPVHLMLPLGRERAQRRGMMIHWGTATETIDIGGLPATAPARTLADLVLRSDRETAVSLMDTWARLGAASLADARAAAGRRPGAARTAAWWRLADERAESPLETRLRLLLTDAGLPPEELQWVVHDPDGHPAARLDLAWPSHGLDVEADGVAYHSSPDALYRDRARQNLLAGQGWTVLRYTWTDVTQRPQHVTAEVCRVLAGGLSRSA